MSEDQINVLIVEDEEIWSRTLHINLNELGYVVTRTVNNVEDALIAFHEVEYDIILMDIHLNGKNSGIELGKIVSNTYHKPFIFVTSSSDVSLIEAKNANPSGYLSKPVNAVSLFFAIQNAINNFSDKKVAETISIVDPLFSSFFVKQGKRYKKIDWNDVACISAGKNYVEVFNTTDKTNYFIRSSLQRTLQTIIPASLQRNFIQVNRSEAVQLSFIIEMSENDLKTAFGTYSITDTYLRELKARMNLLT